MSLLALSFAGAGSEASGDADLKQALEWSKAVNQSIEKMVRGVPPFPYVRQSLEKLAPHAPTTHYRHNRTGEDNADAHLKRQIMGREVVIAITDNKLDFGPWEQIFYGEFDGRRKKRVLIKIIGE